MARTKPYRAPEKRGPKPTLHWVKKLTVKVGERELAMIRLYARKHLGGEETEISTVLRLGLEVLCVEFAPEEIEAERKKETE